MNVSFENFGLYNVDTDYLRYLNGVEPEVQFSEDKDYEQVKKSEIKRNDTYKSISDTEALKIFAALDIKKMIPVKAGLYSRIEFASLSDQKYADLLEKEYRFCQKIQDGILAKAKQIYTEQKQTGVVHPIYCNFAKLEAACDTYGTEEN